MKEEIKEILDYYKRSNKNHFNYEQDKVITYKEAQLLLDYITNLQIENEILKANIEVMNHNYQLLDRCNKVDNYIKVNEHYGIYGKMKEGK